MLLTSCFVGLLAIFGVTAIELGECSGGSSRADYDYIIIGAGAGGGPIAARIAEAGFSVLVVEAGKNVSNANITVPAFNSRALEDPLIELNYTVSEFPSGFRFSRNDSWYPRSQGIGGCTIHNAMVSNIGATKQDFDDISSMSGDPTWSRAHMQTYFKLMEHNLYLTPPNPDHGFEGWLKTSKNSNLTSTDPQLLDVLRTIENSAPLINDFNSVEEVDAIGSAIQAVAVDEDRLRSSAYNRLIDAERSTSGRLTFALETLATKVLLCRTRSGKIAAHGVELAPGLKLPMAADFSTKSAHYSTKRVTARHEIIVSAGQFQSPQLLMLSGIGDKRQLRKHGIPTAVHLPGVGKNLQDNDEVSIIYQMKANFTDTNGCTYLSDPAKDPCFATWLSSGHRNVYGSGARNFITSKSRPELSEPDIITYFNPFYFPGFVRGRAQVIADTHNVFSVVVINSHGSSRGEVLLTGPHPQDPLDIQKFRFQASDGPQDVAFLRDAMKKARIIMAQDNIKAHIDHEILPGADVQTDTALDDHIYQNAFGHHGCCTNAIGPDDDEFAVLNTDFQVRGVENLRVVDVSAFPKIPGHFPMVPTYMISEKAAEVVLQFASLRTNRST